MLSVTVSHLEAAVFSYYSNVYPNSFPCRKIVTSSSAEGQNYKHNEIMVNLIICSLTDTQIKYKSNQKFCIYILTFSECKWSECQKHRNKSGVIIRLDKIRKLFLLVLGLVQC